MRGHLILIMLPVLLLCLTGHIIAGEIHEAAKAGDLEKVKSIISTDRSRLWAQDRLGYTALHWAANRGKWDILRYLLGAGADVNPSGLDGCIPLHCVGNHDCPDMIALLIERGADIGAKNAWGDTPLHLACRKGNRDAAAMLLSKGADINATSNEGWTPLHYARISDHPAVAELLMNRGPLTNITDDYGKIALDYNFKRLSPISLEADKIKEYVGKFSLGEGFFAKTWIEDGRLWVEDYAHDLMYPIAPDSFFCEKEPWTVYFSRDDNGIVDSIFLSFIRQTVGGVKVADDYEAVGGKPKLGLSCRSLTRGELSESDKKNMKSDYGDSDTVAVLITFVLEETPADRAGLRQRDIILSYNKIDIMTADALYKLVGETPSGAEIPVEIIRSGKSRSLKVKLD